MAMTVAVVGAGVSGLIAARVLARKGLKVVLYEKEDYVGGHARTVRVDGIPIDLAFMVFNLVTYPNMVAFFEEIGVEMEPADMSFSVSLNEGTGCEWGSRGLLSLFAQKRNLLNPHFIQMIREVFRFQQDVPRYIEKLKDQNDGSDWSETLGHFLSSRGYSETFRDCYLIPLCGSIWSCSTEEALNFSARAILTFFCNHHLLQVFGRPQWMIVKGRSECYVNKVVEELRSYGCEIKTKCEVHSISRSDKGVLVRDANGGEAMYDRCVIGAHAPDALAILGSEASPAERSILGAVQYSNSDIYVHRDKSLMPKNACVWSSWNFLGSTGGRISITFWINRLQNLGDTGAPILVTLNPPRVPSGTCLKWSTSHPVPSPAAVLAMSNIQTIQGKQHIWFCGAYKGYGFHEDGLKAGLDAAMGILDEQMIVLKYVKQFSLTWSESIARVAVIKFLQNFILKGRIRMIEDGGTLWDIVGKAGSSSNLRSTLKIHRASFYWKVALRLESGLADAYVDGDFSCADAANGLPMLFEILIINQDSWTSGKNTFRGWWIPLLPTAIVRSSASYLTRIVQNNSPTNAGRNIAHPYDLGYEVFSLFLDDTMTYSSAIFEDPKETLKDAQLRKLHRLIDKAKVEKNHKVLEIGFGWGSLAIELVQRTGCKYTGITSSEEQLKFTERRVAEAGLQGGITLMSCDYRKVLASHQYDRIICCETIEAIGHEYHEFFRACEKLLAKDGILVLQAICIPEEGYDEQKRSEFPKEYMLPWKCIPSFRNLTSAVSRTSSLCLEHLDNMGLHYYQTLSCWRDNFHANHSELYRLGFDYKFLRTWDYRFAYCAAAFKTSMLSAFQIVFSRQENTATFGCS